MHPSPMFSFIVIFKNNAESVARALEEVESTLDALRLHGAAELILVDDASTDETRRSLSAARGRLARFHCQQLDSTRGFGQALRVGLAASSGSKICVLDGAGTYPPAKMLEMTEIMDLSACDVVTASPYHPWANVRSRHAPGRFLSKTINRVYRCFTGSNLYGYTCFFRVYRREWLERARPFSDGYIAMSEILIDLVRQGATIVEYPITLHKADYGQTPRQTLAVALEHIQLVRKLLTSPRPVKPRPQPKQNPLSRWALTGRCMF